MVSLTGMPLSNPDIILVLFTKSITFTLCSYFSLVEIFKTLAHNTVLWGNNGLHFIKIGHYRIKGKPLTNS